MKRSILIFGLLIASVCLAKAGDPPLVAGIYKPTFLFLDGSFTAGTAFFVSSQDGKGAVLVTCFHLFGPDGGLQQQMSPDDIAQQIHGAIALSMEDQRTTVKASTYLKVADAAPLSAKDYSKDLAPFVATDLTTPKTFRFSASMPKVGDAVWVYARLRGTDTPKLFSAKISEVNESRLRYVFDDPSFNIAGTSGAPVLNQQGEVVGVNLGGGTSADNKVYGAANPASSVLKELTSAQSH